MSVDHVIFPERADALVLIFREGYLKQKATESARSRAALEKSGRKKLRRSGA